MMKGESTVKLNRLFLLALCVLFVSGGCKYHVVYLTPPPIQDPNQIFGVAGKTIHWLPTGHPFKITFADGVSPCRSTDSLKSDGKNVVICHVLSGLDGDYEYYILPNNLEAPGPSPGSGSTPLPGQTPAPGSSPASGPYPAHVGGCSGCMPSNGVVGDVTAEGSQTVSNGVVGGAPVEGSQTAAKNIDGAQQTSTSSQAASLQEVRIYCDPQSKMAKVDPSNPTVSSGQAVYWKFLGNRPNPGPLFEVTIPANLCSNLPAGTKVNSSSVSCTVATSQPYSFSAYACTPPNGNGSITVQ